MDYVEERVEPWTYLKFPYLKKIGWKGFIEGQDSGVYQATPLSRLNASDGMTTPIAQQEYDRMYKVLGGKPVHNTLAMHWARLVELLHCAEKAVAMLQDEAIRSPEVRTAPGALNRHAVAHVEAPRGVLIHDYKVDQNALIESANFVVATQHNIASINTTIKNAASLLLDKSDAELLDGVGWTLSGSDLLPANPSIQLLGSRGLQFFLGHAADNVPHNTDCLIYSPAIRPNNSERVEAERRRLPQLSYSQMLGWLMQAQKGVCIAGTHGKSTTTAMTGRSSNRTFMVVPQSSTLSERR